MPWLHTGAPHHALELAQGKAPKGLLCTQSGVFLQPVEHEQNPELQGQPALENDTSSLPGTKFRCLTAVKELTLKCPYKKTQVPMKA